MMKKFEIEVGGKKIEFEIKNLAERANSDVMVRCGDSQVFITCVMSDNDVKGLGFFPLTVNYEEKYYAAGKILGSRYIRREGRPSDNAVVISRVIDRTIRPLFEKNQWREVQVIATSLSWDEENDPDILGILGASLALSISDIPWQGPVGAIRIGMKNGKLMLNPTYEEREKSLLDIVFAGVKREEKILINMIESSGEEVKEELILEALKKALPEIKKLINFQEKISAEIGQEKMTIEEIEKPELEREVKKFLGDRIEEILFGRNPLPLAKGEGLNEFKKELIEFVEKNYPEEGWFAKEIFEKEVRKVMQEKILKQEKRVDGRKLDNIREMQGEVGLIPRTHGSGLFCRGLTKSLSILTLGGPGEQQLIEGMEIAGKKRFLHHYNFPPYSTGEVKPLRAPSRREINHGVLAEKALLPLIPESEDFPYTIRIVSEMLSSNGSTSMASVCSSSLALMDAGVPLKRPVAGIAIGLIQDKQKHKLLTDIQGPEDFHGDMDFKIAGTKQGITALQMDVKIPGITEEVLKEALMKGKKARLTILDLMAKILPKPRSKVSPFAPKIYRLQIPTEKIGEVIGPRGHTIKRIIEETGAAIDVESTGIVYITAADEDSAKKAMGMIKNITREIKIGESFLGKATRNLSFGTFLELVPGQEGLLHSSQTEKPLKIGEKVLVKVISIDEQGRINLALEKHQRQYAKRRKRR